MILSDNYGSVNKEAKYEFLHYLDVTAEKMLYLTRKPDFAVHYCTPIINIFANNYNRFLSCKNINVIVVINKIITFFKVSMRNW